MILISIGITAAAYSFIVVKEVRFVPMDITIGSEIGINLDADALHFGTSFRGGSSNRNMWVNNTYDIPLKVQIFFTGELSHWASASDSMFILQPGEGKKVSFYINIPSDAEMKKYEGHAKLVFKTI